MSFEDLPAEIYLNIFQYLSSPALFQCRLLCKSSYSCATDAAFNTFRISSRNIACIIELSKRADLGRKVKTLAFREDTSRNGGLLHRPQLAQLYQTACYIKTIDLRQSEALTLHLKLLRSLTTTSLQHVECVLVASSCLVRSCRGPYLSLNHQLRATIRYLELSELDHSFFSDGTQANILLKYLKGFTNLRSLSIEDKLGMLPIGGYPVTITRSNVINLNVLDVLCTCPQLTHLQMYSEYCYPATNASAANASTTNASSAGNASATEASATFLVHDAIMQKSNVQLLRLILPEFKFPYITYVSHYTTVNLSYLNMQLTQSIRFYSWVNSLDPPILLAFALHLKNIQRVIFQTYLLDSYEPVNTNQERLEMNLLNLVNRFIIPDRFTACHLELNSTYASRGESTTIEMSGGHLSLKFSFPLVTNHQGEFLNRVQCLGSLHRVFGQHYCVKSIYLEYGDNFSPIDDDLLSFLFTRFDQLQAVHIHPNTQGSFISLRSHCPYPDEFNTLQLIKSTKSSVMQTAPASTSQTLRHAFFDNIQFSRQSIEALCELVPNLQTLKLLRCGDSFVKAMMNSPFQHLQELTFDVPSYYNRFVFLDIEMQGYKTPYYQWQLPKRNRITKFERSSLKYMHSHKRWTSKYKFAVPIKCTRVDAIRVIHRRKYNSYFTSTVYPWRDRQPQATSSGDSSH